jgi:Leucine-rich repeat (LRR) protein
MSDPSTVLTESMVVERAKLPLAEIKKLNAWGLGLTDVSIVCQMPNLEIISLAVNKIRSLKPFSSCTNLTDLLLRRNAISDFEELRHLDSLTNLKTLWLSENPIASEPLYREQVVKHLPKLAKLDDALVTDTDRRLVSVENRVEHSKTISPAGPARKSGNRRRVRATSAKSPSEGDAIPESTVHVDEPALSTILSLLPQLSVEGLEMVARTAKEIVTKRGSEVPKK